jgi:hypothetical protein
MMDSSMLTRRKAIVLLGVGGTALAGRASAQRGISVKLYKEATCGCCGLWARHMSSAGFAVETVDVADINRTKAQLIVPARLATCHTAKVGDYLIEGHVPAVVVKRLLAEKPAGRGLAVPGMPVGSPGMEGGTPETYTVFLFERSGAVSFYARCRGDQIV